MRIFLALAIALSACASHPKGAVNVATVRHEINDTIHKDSQERSVTSMGKVTAERAVVYTTAKSGARQEETWIKAAGGWGLEASTAMN